MGFVAGMGGGALFVPTADALAAVYGGGAAAAAAIDDDPGGGGGGAFLKLPPPPPIGGLKDGVFALAEDGERPKPGPDVGGTRPLPCRDVCTRRAVVTRRLLMVRLSIMSRASLSRCS